MANGAGVRGRTRYTLTKEALEALAEQKKAERDRRGPASGDGARAQWLNAGWWRGEACK